MSNAKDGASGDSNKENDRMETAVKVAGIVLATSIGISLLRSKKVQEKVENAIDEVANTREELSLKLRGAQIVGEADSNAQDFQDQVQEQVEDKGREAKRAISGFFGDAKKAAHKVKNARRGLIVEKGDTLWSLSKKYHVSVDVIRTSNSLAGDKILAGQELVIPGAGLMDKPVK